jgi:hypothetical protein
VTGLVRITQRVRPPWRWAALGIGLVAATGLVLLWLIPAGVDGDAPLSHPAVAGGEPDAAVAPDVTRARPPVVNETSAPTGAHNPAAEAAVVARFVSQLLSGIPALGIEHLSAMIARARDPDEPFEHRVGAIRWLARFGDDEALDVLENLLLSDVSRIRVAVAMALGECSNPAAARILTSLLADDDPDVVAVAIHSLANHRDPETAQILKDLIADTSLSEELRASAAAALGGHGGAKEVLLDAYAQSEGDLSSGILEGLAQQPFSEVESVFLQLIEDPEASVDQKLEAIEALAEGSPETADFLLEMARSADDPELRSAAIDALALSGESADVLADLGAMLRGESSENVRADIYNNLAFNADRVIEGSNTSELVNFALAETGNRPQLEGYRMVASMLHERYDTDLADTFDASMVTWLQDSAENGGDRYTRHLSIGALQLAGTPGALGALLDLSHSSDPTVSQSAETALSVAGKAGGLYAP